MGSGWSTNFPRTASLGQLNLVDPQIRRTRSGNLTAHRPPSVRYAAPFRPPRAPGRPPLSSSPQGGLHFVLLRPHSSPDRTLNSALRVCSVLLHTRCGLGWPVEREMSTAPSPACGKLRPRCAKFPCSPRICAGVLLLRCRTCLATRLLRSRDAAPGTRMAEMGGDYPTIKARLSALEAELVRARAMPISKARFGPGYFYCLEEKQSYIQDLMRRIKKDRDALASGEVLPSES